MVKGQYGNMMKQVQKMQADMARVEQELNETNIEASAGGGAVKAVVTGKQQIVEIKIDPSVVDPEDVEILEDMVVAAVSEALRQSQELAQSKLAAVTGPLAGGLGGLGLPGF
ncbi:MAG: YbaB/EbfC family nucleoid-associated protein [Actinobacteria bacterium]|nr:YbaB/EbfC family nucleoid-associated protein [Actinomycetota bacterium]